jgi:hypothetical protein
MFMYFYVSSDMPNGIKNKETVKCKRQMQHGITCSVRAVVACQIKIGNTLKVDPVGGITQYNNWQ